MGDARPNLKGRKATMVTGHLSGPKRAPGKVGQHLTKLKHKKKKRGLSKLPKKHIVPNRTPRAPRSMWIVLKRHWYMRCFPVHAMQCYSSLMPPPPDPQAEPQEEPQVHVLPRQVLARPEPEAPAL